MNVSSNQKPHEPSATDRLPEVAIVIPTLSSGSTLRSCLESVRQLSYPGSKMELIIVDGGSKDETVEIARSYGAKVLIRPGASRGGACNDGARETAGQFIAMTDSDAIVTREWLSLIVAEMQADPKLVAIGGPDLGLDDSSVGKAGTAIDLFRRRKQEEGWKAVFKIKGVNSAYRKRAFLELGGFDGALLFGEESELHARMVALGKKIKYSPGLVVYHHRHLQRWRSLGRSFWTARRTAPLLLRPCTLQAALCDPSSSLASLLFLLVAISFTLPVFVLGVVQADLGPLFDLAAVFACACIIYSIIVVRRTRSPERFSLFLVAVSIVAVQSILRGLGVMVGVIEAVCKRGMGKS